MTTPRGLKLWNRRWQSARRLPLHCSAAPWHWPYAGEAERGIDWAERALRISPFDRLNPLPYHALAIAHFLRGRYDEAAHAARRAVQSLPNSNSSPSRSVLAAALAKLGRIEEAKAVALQVLALDPSFSAARFCAATGLPTRWPNQ